MKYIETKNKIVIGITGASGAIYAKQLIENLSKLENQINDVAIIFSENGINVWNYELENYKIEKIPFKIYNNQDFFAPFASGSSTYNSMVICPCTMGTLGKIANGISENLISRTADVMLKENRNLIIVPRETPYNLIHVENIKKLILAGAKICPASPSFYSKPINFQELIQTVIDKIIKLLNIKTKSFNWNETS